MRKAGFDGDDETATIYKYCRYIGWETQIRDMQLKRNSFGPQSLIGEKSANSSNFKF